MKCQQVGQGAVHRSQLAHQAVDVGPGLLQTPVFLGNGQAQQAGCADLRLFKGGVAALAVAFNGGLAQGVEQFGQINRHGEKRKRKREKKEAAEASGGASVADGAVLQQRYFEHDGAGALQPGLGFKPVGAPLL